MTNPQAHLLAVPREIRDLIYIHLTRKATISWIKKVNLPNADDAICAVTVENAPLLEVLLTCSRLHEEYPQSIIFEGAAPTMRMVYDRYGSYAETVSEVAYAALKNKITFDEECQNRERMVAAVSKYTRNMTVLVDLRTQWKQRIVNPWEVCDCLLALVMLWCQKLSTLRVAVREERELDFVHSAGPYPPLYSAEFIPLPKVVISDLKLLQRAVGYRAQQRKPYGHVGLYGSNGWLNSIRYPVPTWEPTILYNGGFVFGTGDAAPNFWDPETIVSIFPPDVRFDIDEIYLDDIPFGTQYLALEMREWRDKRESKALNWEEVDEDDEEAQRRFDPIHSYIHFRQFP